MVQCQEIPDVEIVEDLFERVGVLSRAFPFFEPTNSCRCLSMKRKKKNLEPMKRKHKFWKTVIIMEKYISKKKFKVSNQPTEGRRSQVICAEVSFFKKLF